MFFKYPNEYLAGNIEKFKAMLPINDPKLQIFLWNSINVWPDELEDVNEEDFTQEEYEFIKERFKAKEVRDTLGIDNHPNLNSDIFSDRVILRKPNDEDAQLYRNHLKNDGDFGTFTGMKANNNNLDMATLFKSPYTFVVIEREGGKMIGMVGLYGYDFIRRMANIEWYIFKTYRGNGYAKEAVTALANKAFDHKLFEMYEGVKADIMKKHFANIDIIRATIRVSNIASQRTALSCGFNEQYLDRRHAIVNENTFEDCIIYDLER